MSQGRGNFGGKRKTVKKQPIELESIIQFLSMIGSMACALFIVCVIFLMILPTDETGKVIYTMILVVNLISGLGSLFAAHMLKKKNDELKENERAK